MSHQNALPLIWPSRYTADNYLVAECNALAWQSVQKTGTWHSPVLLLLGEAASGKTHLATIFAQLHQAVFLTSAEELQQALNLRTPRILENADRLLTEQPGLTEAVFHLVNHAMAEKVPLLITASRPPSQWVTLPDLLSRLQAAPHVTLEHPSEDMVTAAYQKLFSDRGILVDRRVLDYLTMRSERSFEMIRAAVDKLDTASLEQGRKITVPLIQSIDLF